MALGEVEDGVVVSEAFKCGDAVNETLRCLAYFISGAPYSLEESIQIYALKYDFGDWSGVTKGQLESVKILPVLQEVPQRVIEAL